MSKLLGHLPALCNVVRRIAMEAGQVTLEYFDEGMKIAPDIKTDGSPVTEADKKAELFIMDALRQDISADIPVVVEEAISQGAVHDLSSQDYFWLVDLLDGTREFIEGSPDYTVNIALIKNHVPILGVIYAPARGEMFSAYGEGTATRWTEDTGHEKAIKAKRPSRGGLVVITSKNREREQIDKFLSEQKVEKIIRKGSSLKICAVASGRADLYPGFGQTCEWDTAAGQAILEAAGGQIVTMDGVSLTYGDKKDFFNPPFLARSNFLA